MRIGLRHPAAETGGVLLERERELGLLDALVHGALEGDAPLVLLEGPAGIGKSSLLAKARATAAAAGFRVLTARGSDLERDMPYGVVRQLFASLLVDPDCRDRWLVGSAQPAARVFGPPAEDAETPDPGSYGVLHGLFWLTANIASDGPLCLSIDDLQWCDPASLRFIAYLERRLEGLGVLSRPPRVRMAQTNNRSCCWTSPMIRARLRSVRRP
jgi:predicted ATPase